MEGPRPQLLRVRADARRLAARHLGDGGFWVPCIPSIHAILEAILDAGIVYGILAGMETARKITVEVPQELLDQAQRASGAGITQTVRTGLQLVAASQTYARLRQLRGKVRFSRTLAELKADR